MPPCIRSDIGAAMTVEDSELDGLEGRVLGLRHERFACPRVDMCRHVVVAAFADLNVHPSVIPVDGGQRNGPGHT